MPQDIDINAFLIYISIITILTFAVFGYDKRQSEIGGWRVPEKTLFTLAALGGSLGILAGQRFFRHKTRKPSFNIKFFAILIMQGILAVAYSEGLL